MNIVLADVQSVQPERADATSGKITTDDEFSRLVDRQLRKDEQLSTQVEYPQAVENKEKIPEADESSAMFEQSPEWVDGLNVEMISNLTNVEMISNLTELESAQLTYIIDESGDSDSVGDIELEVGYELPLDGNPLPPLAAQIVQQPIQQESIRQILPVTKNPLKSVSIKADGQAADSADSLLMEKLAVSGKLDSAAINETDNIVEKLNFARVNDFQLPASTLNNEGDISNNLFRLHSPTSLSSLNQSLPPHLESLTLANPRDQAALSSGLGDRIQWMVNQKLNSATIRMDPPMLGRLEVHIQLVDDITNVTINTQHAQTRDLIDNASMKLREYLQENGYQNVNVDVSHQQQQQASDDSGDNDNLPADENPSMHASGNIQEVPGNRYFSSDSVVDYFA